MAIKTKTPKEIIIKPREFTISLTENEAHFLVQRLKFKQRHLPDLTEDIWKSLEVALGYTVKEDLD